jgi:hypothetical protein
MQKQYPPYSIDRTHISPRPHLSGSAIPCLIKEPLVVVNPHFPALRSGTGYFNGLRRESNFIGMHCRVRQIDSIKAENQSGGMQNPSSNKKSSKADSLREGTKQFDDL